LYQTLPKWRGEGSIKRREEGVRGGGEVEKPYANANLVFFSSGNIFKPVFQEATLSPLWYKRMLFFNFNLVSRVG